MTIVLRLLLAGRRSGRGDAPRAETVDGVPREAAALVAEDDVAGGVDVDREEVVVRLRGLPAEPRLDRGAIARTDVGLVHLARAAVELEVAVGAEPRGHDAVDDTARVTAEVERLRRAPHHPEHELAVDELGLDRADAREAVASKRAEQAELVAPEPLLAELRELRALGRELAPAHQARSTARRGPTRKPASSSSGSTSDSVTGPPSNRSTARRFLPTPPLTWATSAASAGRNHSSSGSRSGTSERPPRSTKRTASPPRRTTCAPATRAARAPARRGHGSAAPYGWAGSAAASTSGSGSSSSRGRSSRRRSTAPGRANCAPPSPSTK